jgi:hypothetical protein
MFAFVGLVVCAVIGMATGSWIWFGVALAAHLIASAIVISSSVKSAQTGTEADPESERLDRIAGDAVADDRPRNVESELEALKREPSARR